MTCLPLTYTLPPTTLTVVFPAASAFPAAILPATVLPNAVLPNAAMVPAVPGLPARTTAPALPASVPAFPAVVSDAAPPGPVLTTQTTRLPWPAAGPPAGAVVGEAAPLADALTTPVMPRPAVRTMAARTRPFPGWLSMLSFMLDSRCCVVPWAADRRGPAVDRSLAGAA